MDTFFGAKRLEIVDLSHNRIRVIPPGLFDSQHDIVEIYLNHNRLTALPSDIFKLNSLKLIHLMENPWTCTCEMRQWRQSVVNKIRAGRLEAVSKCEETMRQSKSVKCETSYVANYSFDHRMSPKCEQPANVQGKSVFYALRRVMQCKAAAAPRVVKIQRTKFTDAQKREMIVQHMRERKKKERKAKVQQYRLQQRGRVESLKVQRIVDDSDDISNDLRKY